MSSRKGVKHNVLPKSKFKPTEDVEVSQESSERSSVKKDMSKVGLKKKKGREN